MEYRKATSANISEIFDIVQNTIKTVYPRYYPKEVVDFFCELHNRENILKDIKSGHVGILLEKEEAVGTGSLVGNHITRVYVLPSFQGKGYGSYIMQCLEDEIASEYEKCILDASLPACCMYENRGYKTVRHGKQNVGNHAVLVYEVMEKIVSAANE